jgi:hypothetical protein
VHWLKVQVWLAPQLWPQAPQWAAFDAVSRHCPEQSVRPAWQLHAPITQLVPAPHTVPHWPQLALLVARSTQVPPQSVCPAGHVVTVAPAVPPLPPVLMPPVPLPPLLPAPPPPMGEFPPAEQPTATAATTLIARNEKRQGAFQGKRLWLDFMRLLLRCRRWRTLRGCCPRPRNRFLRGRWLRQTDRL